MEKGRPISTIFLIKSKTTPTERETTVKAAIEKNKGGNNSKSIHLSNKGIIFHFVSNKFLNRVNKNRLLNIVINQMNCQDNSL